MDNTEKKQFEIEQLQLIIREGGNWLEDVSNTSKSVREEVNQAAEAVKRSSRGLLYSHQIYDVFLRCYQQIVAIIRHARQMRRIHKEHGVCTADTEPTEEMLYQTYTAAYRIMQDVKSAHCDDELNSSVSCSGK